MVVLSGMGHIPRGSLGALLLARLRNCLRNGQGHYSRRCSVVLIDPESFANCFYGLALILVMLYRPTGLWPARHIRGTPHDAFARFKITSANASGGLTAVDDVSMAAAGEIYG